MLDLQLDSRHLGQIAYKIMAHWESKIADELELTEADVSGIKTKHPNNLELQS